MKVSLQNCSLIIAISEVTVTLWFCNSMTFYFYALAIIYTGQLSSAIVYLIGTRDFVWLIIGHSVWYTGIDEVNRELSKLSEKWTTMCLNLAEMQHHMAVTLNNDNWHFPCVLLLLSIIPMRANIFIQITHSVIIKNTHSIQRDRNDSKTNTQVRSFTH